ncbi:MAG TPA: hypothetical protein VIL46_08600 [Gemmataceae bacterium]
MTTFLQILLGFLLIDLACVAGLLLVAWLAYRRRLPAPGEPDDTDGAEGRQLLGCALVLLLLIAAVYGGVYAAWRLWSA